MRSGLHSGWRKRLSTILKTFKWVKNVNPKRQGLNMAGKLFRVTRVASYLPYHILVTNLNSADTKTKIAKPTRISIHGLFTMCKNNITLFMVITYSINWDLKLPNISRSWWPWQPQLFLRVNSQTLACMLGIFVQLERT